MFLIKILMSVKKIMVDAYITVIIISGDTTVLAKKTTFYMKMASLVLVSMNNTENNMVSLILKWI